MEHMLLQDTQEVRAIWLSMFLPEDQQNGRKIYQLQQLGKYKKYIIKDLLGKVEVILKEN